MFGKQGNNDNGSISEGEEFIGRIGTEFRRWLQYVNVVLS